ncbi:hypothetical protein CEXT_46491 [Caerostris extrusa]|uniref:Uncharacterized protein n=1 Tax=Caerostris extrusa TaxID=172846 RepID=A0AAV4MPL7_CAEEX|nr:hypothetical protein CEXT_46491 [Caerostris extrusa]
MLSNQLEECVSIRQPAHPISVASTSDKAISGSGDSCGHFSLVTDTARVGANIFNFPFRGERVGWAVQSIRWGNVQVKMLDLQ